MQTYKEYPKSVIMESLLTIKEVTAKLKISRMTLHKLTTGKKLPCYKIGRQIRYKVEDVEKFLKTGKSDTGC
jgi:excisionase family DNA binding protein